MRLPGEKRVLAVSVREPCRSLAGGRRGGCGGPRSAVSASRDCGSAWRGGRRVARRPGGRTASGSPVACGRPRPARRREPSAARGPWGRAAASPARVRSRSRAVSNSASAAKRWKVSRPVGLVVSMASWSERKPTSGSPSAVTTATRSWRDRPRRSSRQTTTTSPACVVEQLLAGSGLRGRARGGVLEEALAAGGDERVALEGEVLVGRRDPGVAEQHGVVLLGRRGVAERSRRARFAASGSATSSATALSRSERADRRRGLVSQKRSFVRQARATGWPTAARGSRGSSRASSRRGPWRPRRGGVGARPGSRRRSRGRARRCR